LSSSLTGAPLIFQYSPQKSLPGSSEANNTRSAPTPRFSISVISQRAPNPMVHVVSRRRPACAARLARRHTACGHGTRRPATAHGVWTWHTGFRPRRPAPTHGVWTWHTGFRPPAPGPDTRRVDVTHGARPRHTAPGHGTRVLTRVPRRQSVCHPDTRCARQGEPCARWVGARAVPTIGAARALSTPPRTLRGSRAPGGGSRAPRVVPAHGARYAETPEGARRPEPRRHTTSAPGTQHRHRTHRRQSRHTS